MTNSEIARDKLRLWGYISRAKKVGKKIPDHWLIYGNPSTSTSEILHLVMEAHTDKMLNLFDRDDRFYREIRKK